MYNKGGFYADIDLEPFTPINNWPSQSSINENQFIISPQIPWNKNNDEEVWDRMATWGFLSAPKHPLLLKIMETMYQVFEENGKNIDL